MVAAANHLAPSGEAPGDAQRRGGRLGAGPGEDRHVGGGEAVQERLDEAQVQRVVHRQEVAPSGLIHRRPIDGFLGVPEQEGSISHDEIDVLVAVDVPDPAALAALEVHGGALGIEQRRPGAVDPARDQAARGEVEGSRAFVRTAP
ncbi:hypothetical protein WMF31_21565 [Sorangium sp. So ce1036]